MRRKLLLSIVLMLVLSELGTLNSTIPTVSAAVSPYIAVVPESTVDSAFAPGMNYTISIYTDYDGDDVNGYGFELTYDPSVLEGIEVVNGDLINATYPDPDMFTSVGFNNTVGRLRYTNNFLAGIPPFPLTSGPGTLANVTFRVVARGTSDITLEDQGMLGEHAYRTRLYGYLDGGSGDLINIIDSATMPDHIQHGFFDNRFQRNVAVGSVIAPVKSVVGELVPINVTVANLGAFSEVANVTVRYDTTYVDSENVTLAIGASETVSFSWNTTGIAQGIHTINATATIDDDGDLTDNWNTTTIILAMHDVAVEHILAPTTAHVGEIATIRVSVANLGWYNETFEVEVTYDTSIIGNPKPINLLPGASDYVDFSWNTTGVSPGSYTITAKAILATDEDSTNNLKTKSIVVTPPGVIGGTVTDASNGDPIVGASVTADGHTATTNADGHYSITDVPAGTYTVTAEATGYHSSSTSATVFAGNTTTVDFALTPLPGAITGTVTDASNGDPIVGASVTADGHTATTNANGHYSITDVPAGTYTVTASATGYESASQHSITVAAGDPTTVNFALRVSSTISISVDLATITVGKSTTISGSITPALQGVNVIIQYRLSSGEAWTNLTTVTTNEYSQYSFQWTPETADTYEVKALWSGDENTSSAESDVQTITVQEMPSGILSNPYAVAIVAAGVAAIIMAATFYFLRIRKPKTK